MYFFTFFTLWMEYKYVMKSGCVFVVHSLEREREKDGCYCLLSAVGCSSLLVRVLYQLYTVLYTAQNIQCTLSTNRQYRNVSIHIIYIYAFCIQYILHIYVCSRIYCTPDRNTSIIQHTVYTVDMVKYAQCEFW